MAGGPATVEPVGDEDGCYNPHQCEGRGDTRNCGEGCVPDAGTEECVEACAEEDDEVDELDFFCGGCFHGFTVSAYLG